MQIIKPSADQFYSFSLPAINDKDAALTKFKRGTTTLAFKYKGGIIVACDSRASQGSFIASQSVRKIIEINKYILGTMAGGAADCSFWERYLTRVCKLYELNNDRRINVGHAAKILADIYYSYNGYGLSCGTMIAGYDGTKQIVELYYVDDTGARVLGDMFSVGSGSTFAYGILNSGYSYDMSDADAYELAKRAIFHAGHRDGASGGVIRVYHVKKDGWEKIIEADDFFDVYKQYYPNN